MQLMTKAIIIARRYAIETLGAVAAEYAFLAAFVAIAAVVGMLLVGPNMQQFFIDTGVEIQNAGSGNFTNDPIPS